MSGQAIRAVTLVFTAALLLTGCVVSPPPQTPAPTAVPVADPFDEVVTHITVRPERLDLVNGMGIVVAELSYDADAAVFVDAVSNALGGPPSVEERAGGHEWFAWTRYTWPGVEVADDHEPAGIASDMNVNIRFTHPVVGDGITVSTVQGFRPGDDLEAFADELGEDWYGNGYDQFPAETGPDVGERGYHEWDDTYAEYANANAVSVSDWGGPAADATVTSVIFAPWNFGIGHV